MIYLIATIGEFGSRTVGYFEDLEKAKQCVKENWGDLCEAGYYEYAVIEDVELGIYQSYKSNPIFYKWNDKDLEYQEIERPNQFKGWAGFTIG